MNASSSYEKTPRDEWEGKTEKEGWKDKKPKKVENEEKQLIIRGWQTDREGGGRQGNGTMAR